MKTNLIHVMQFFFHFCTDFHVFVLFSSSFSVASCAGVPVLKSQVMPLFPLFALTLERLRFNFSRQCNHGLIVQS